MESGILASHYNSPGSLSLSLRRWPGDGIRGAQNKMLFRLLQFRDHMFIMADLSPMTVYIHWVLSTYLFIFIYFRLAKCKSNWYKNYAMSFTYWIIHSQNDHKQYPRNTDAATRTGPDPTQSLISFQCPARARSGYSQPSQSSFFSSRICDCYKSSFTTSWNVDCDEARTEGRRCGCGRFYVLCIFISAVYFLSIKFEWRIRIILQCSCSTH